MTPTEITILRMLDDLSNVVGDMARAMPVDDRKKQEFVLRASHVRHIANDMVNTVKRRTK